ncbi:MAG TPA: hypothetical protein VGQ87_04110 [Patescibacteria group bacterium]|jgi:hypothetical protein|nr:hypothetical protein [Patescibacteria group bacterium]
MSKKTLWLSLVVLLIILTGSLIYKNRNRQHFYNPSNSTSTNNQQTEQRDEKKVNLPIALDNSSVGSAFVHYFLTGKLQQVTSVAEGTKISLENSVGLPDLIITHSTRISRITPPYETSKPIPLSIKDLKPGQTLDLSLEYDLNHQVWFLHDVFLPTDKNK